MAKFHIDKNGKPAPCKATKRPCIYEEIGGKHFDTIEEATAHADRTNEIAQKLVSEVSINDYDIVSKNKNNFFNNILANSPTKAGGWDAEVFLGSEYARKMGLTDALVLNENGTYTPVSSTGKSFKGRYDTQELKDKIRIGRKIAAEAYERKFDFKDKKTNPVRVIYFKKDSDSMFVQTGTPDTLDAIKADNGSIKVLEMKKTIGSGAQMTQRTVSVNTDGGFNLEEIDLNPEVEKVIESSNIYENEGGEIKLKVPPQEAMKQFVKDYKRKGASELVYMNAQRKGMSISLDGSEEDIANELIRQGLVARLKIRSNQTVGTMNQESLNRFVINKSNLYSGDIDEENATIDFGQLNKEKMTMSRGKVKVGEFLTNIKWKDRMSTPPETKIDIMKLQRFVPVLSGDIKLASSKRY